MGFLFFFYLGVSGELKAEGGAGLLLVSKNYMFFFFLPEVVSLQELKSRSAAGATTATVAAAEGRPLRKLSGYICHAF